MAKKNKKKKPHRGFWIFVKIQIVLMLLVLGAVGYYYLAGYGKKVEALRQEAVSIVASATEDTFRATQTTVVYDVNDIVISTVKGEKDVYYTEYENIPANVTNAIISIEDKKFYDHIGIDFMAIIRAALAMLQNGEVKQGGSTITQQLARTVFLSNERTWQRKVEEIFIALELEKKFTKDQILEFYLNNVYFANGFYGIEAASRGYFSLPTEELTLSQVAFLCAIPNNPTLYDPLVHQDNTIKRRDRILNQMRLDGIITDKTYSGATSEKIELHQTRRKRNNFVETFTYYCATKELMRQQGFEFKNFFETEEEEAAYKDEYDKLYKECQSTLFTAGYRIYTSIDLKKQKKLQKSIDTHLNEYKDKEADGTYKLQSAGVCIENETGYVVAIVGGRSQKYEGYTLNRAYQSYRQPGSAIKPLIVYTPQFENGYTPDSIVTDQPVEDGPKQKSYLGDITIRTAVEKSKNTIAWQLFEELTPKKGLAYLLNMQFGKIDSNDYYLPAALGGLYHGVSPLEMASAYATIENDGYYREPTCIVKITDADGNVILETEQEEKSVYKTNAARMMVDVLKGVLTNGTAKGKGLGDIPCAGKTGTTNDNKDGWFVGFTHYYTTSIWVGYDKPKKLDVLQGATYPAEIWQDYMKKIHTKQPLMDFMPYVDYREQNQESEEE